MDAKDVASMTANALNSLERRIGHDIAEMKAELKHDMAEMKAELKHDIHLLNVKVDVNQRATDEKLDRGFQQIMEHLDRGVASIHDVTVKSSGGCGLGTVPLTRSGFPLSSTTSTI